MHIVILSSVDMESDGYWNPIVTIQYLNLIVVGFYTYLGAEGIYFGPHVVTHVHYSRWGGVGRKWGHPLGTLCTPHQRKGGTYMYNSQITVIIIKLLDHTCYRAHNITRNLQILLLLSPQPREEGTLLYTLGYRWERRGHYCIHWATGGRGGRGNCIHWGCR